MPSSLSVECLADCQRPRGLVEADLTWPESQRCSLGWKQCNCACHMKRRNRSRKHARPETRSACRLCGVMVPKSALSEVGGYCASCLLQQGLDGFPSDGAA